MVKHKKIHSKIFYAVLNFYEIILRFAWNLSPLILHVRVYCTKIIEKDNVIFHFNTDLNELQNVVTIAFILLC